MRNIIENTFQNEKKNSLLIRRIGQTSLKGPSSFFIGKNILKQQRH